MSRGPWVDLLPEKALYKDTGCELAPRCLNCPLAVCKYDDPDEFHRRLRRERDLEKGRIIRLEKLTVQEAAERFGVTKRTIFRIMARCGEAEKVTA